MALFRIARFHVGKRQVMQRIRPVGRPPRRVAKRRDRLGEIGLLQVRDPQRVIAVCLARIDTYRLFQQVRSRRILLIEQQRTSLEERIAPFQIKRLRRQPQRRLHEAGSAIEIALRLRILVARQIAQQHLLRLVFQRHTQHVFFWIKYLPQAVIPSAAW